MGSQAKEEYFEVLLERYKDAGRREKAKMIDECRAVCGDHRKHAIRHFKGISGLIRALWRLFIGMFAYRVDFTDIATAWMEQRAVRG